MDEMKVESKLMRGLIANLIQKEIRKKLGCNVELELNVLDVKGVDGDIHARISAEANISRDELMKILKNICL